MTQDDNYQKVVDSLKRRKKGATVADICAATALSLHEVRELLPKAADEYSGHLKVTQSGEILYYFPDGFSSRYRGLGAWMKKAFGFCKNALKAASVFLFKVWIMVMLVGYFTFFIALALASVILSVAVQSKSSNSSRRNVSFGPNLFSLIWRIWFYSEITRPRYEYGRAARKKTPGRPMHKAIFSFVFGEDDPNKDWEERKNRAVITYLQANRGIISLAEYMAFTGENSIDAEKSILAFCSKYGGSPEVTEDGTVVYRFDELLLRADSGSFAELSPPVKRLKTFSFNSKSMNGWFIVINAVNLIFGSYFLFQSFAAGQSYFYAFTHRFIVYFMGTIITEPHNFIRIVLGLTPFLFSFFFWLIPLVRYFSEKRENGEIKLENFKRIAFGKIWSSPANVEISNLITPVPECCPENPAAAGDRAVKELGAISAVEVELNEEGKTLYSFSELENEKRAIEKYRAAIDTKRSKLGDTVFDSGQ
jgi:hypothetical protein